MLSEVLGGDIENTYCQVDEMLRVEVWNSGSDIHDMRDTVLPKKFQVTCHVLATE